ncbi:hypothetical protein RND71_020349 [Anisodus tanguticus]|uniref:Uncharacterized protein n=1 Tax=Anisodus tanguticus TaxID=243964 RepID=A0AAE1S2C0_9SOLA|nr:hypothetical protein RND71_020349 [Anisodus tanguticus]
MHDAADPRAGEVLQKDIKRLSKSDEADHREEIVLQKDIKKLSKSDTAEPRAGEVLRKDNINLSKSDAADPRAGEVLRKDIKRWSKSGKPDGTGSRIGTSNIGMSSVGIPIGELLSHQSTSAESIRSFQRLAAEMRVFEIEKIVSRKTIEKLLEEFNEIAK